MEEKQRMVVIYNPFRSTYQEVTLEDLRKFIESAEKAKKILKEIEKDG